ncbi:hypothetical protein [Brevibacillus parabrevis]|uniref:Uncharacterized protein n=1 Tax=Brevibacillus parabrevis TaxID=54914 RepID=A0A4Y3PPR0_BREPA|nr:hypothetical protein [Brevibacillus parabrevis]RNB95847.1 hypothetical protein EDM60_09095 [Brevibacillus parabrevis]GEB33358.1 hypothetical protein BPA01_29380 [Brevibacillus parabrevis]
MSVSNANKQEICERNQELLRIIYFIGNKVMLLKQLSQYAFALGLASNLSDFYSQIAKLEQNEIIRREAFSAYGRKSQLQMITLRKYGIRYVEGKPNSYSVASVPRATSNERILVSVFKNCYILSKILPRIYKESKIITLDKIFDLLKRDCSTLLLNKNEGIRYLSELTGDHRLQPYLDIVGIEHDIEQMRIVANKRSQGLKKGSYATNGKGKGKKIHSSLESSLNEAIKAYNNVSVHDNLFVSPKNKRIECFSVDSMLNCHYHIAQVKIIHNRPVITVLMFDIHNKQDAHRIAADIACIFHMLNRYMKNEFRLKIGVVCLDEVASIRVKNASNAFVRDFVTKEIKGTRLSTALNDWCIDVIMQEQIEVYFTHYDVYNQFLDGIKHANLLRQ